MSVCPRPYRVVVVLAAALATALSACTPGTSGLDPVEPCRVPPADVSTVPGWVGYLVEHRDNVSYVLDDGRGTRIEHRADAVMAMASASKALNLVAYTRAVALDQVRPDEPVRIGDWERWSSVGSEQSHASALDFLGVPREGTRARDPDRTITIEQLANQMMIWSDNAAPDYLRARLGDQAMVDAARDVGWGGVELPSTTGFIVGFFTPEFLPDGISRAERRATEWDLARRYATDPVFRADVDVRPPPPGLAEARYNDRGPGGSARQLASLWKAVGEGRFPGAAYAQQIAEQGPSQVSGFVGVGAKGGSMAGTVARGTELRRDDGSVAIAVLIVREISDADLRLVESTSGFNEFVTASAADPGMVRRLSCGAIGA